MGHQIAKFLLERARTMSDRADAVREAVALGMPLHEVEAYLDYLDANPPDRGTAEKTPTSPSRHSEAGTNGQTRHGRRPWHILKRRLVWTTVAASLLITLAAIPLYRSWSGNRVAEPSCVAQVRGTPETEWSDDGAPNDDGGAPAGRRLRLRQGLAQVAFQGGAVAILQGPAVLELESPGSGRLIEGALTARVPPEAIGFTIHTPWAAVIDRGTEFGVRVQPDGLSEVEVFAGKVEVLPGAGPQAESPGHTLGIAEALRVLPPVAGASPRVERMAAGSVHFVRSLKESAAGAEALTAIKQHLLHHYTFEGLTPAEKYRDQRGDLHLHEVAMVSGNGGGSIETSAAGPDRSAQAIRPFRATSMGNSRGLGLESREPFHPPQAMTVELVLNFAGIGNESREAGIISAAVATRESPEKCGFLIATIDDGRLVQLLDSRAAWLESGVKFQPGRWYYVASTFRVEGEQTIVNTYVADLSRGRDALEWVVKDQTVPGVPASSCLGIGHGFDGENGRAYPWPGALHEIAIYGVVLDRDALQARRAAMVGKHGTSCEAARAK